MEEKIRLDLKFFFDFEYQKIKNNMLDYHFALILLIYIVLEYKDVDGIKNIVISLINEEAGNNHGEDWNDNLFLNVINELAIDFNPDGYWSKFPNIWKENINSLGEYMDRMKYKEKEGFYIHLSEFKDTIQPNV